MKSAIIAVVAAVLGLGPVTALAKPAAPKPVTKPAKPDGQKADQGLSPIQKKAIDQYEKVIDCYMHSDFDGLKVELAAMRLVSKLSPSARRNLAYIRKTIPEYRPIWWKNCRSASNISFRAKIWGRPFVANYMPTQPNGKRETVKLVKNRIQIVAQWQPHMVDDPQPVEGALAKAHELRRRHIGESLVWYELGRNYVPTFLPVKQAVFLYEKESAMFSHVQEFLAGMSSLYHSSPKARLASLFLQIDPLKKNHAGSACTRSGHAIGAIILARVLSEPKKWPGFKLPTKVPKALAELNTIIYMYDRIDPKWSIDEDKNLREMARKFVLSNGRTILSSRGSLLLPNKLRMNLMAASDRQTQLARDAWVAAKLKAIIKASGKEKKPEVKK